ncbi:MAG TPA: TIGR03557 family F420-dependent LLM class oxidoreductase [Acidimicrobiia bacterium]|nr:TIGR03557 family F420-dependent LLM class oxidoreductase [Acidimicrobiia bacterium]
MLEIGYALSSEEHRPGDLVRFAVAAEESGFGFALISDHFHPWTDAQGQSPFVWATLGGIAQATQRLRVGTGVTCPTFRIHPALVAHAAATVADMMPGRFFLGVGSGENLNEHILGDAWPPVGIRLQMLEEAVAIIRELFTGEQVTHDGDYYTVHTARLYTLPAEPPPIMVAAAGPMAAELAGRIGDGLITTAPVSEIVDAYRRNGGDGPRYGMIHVCYASDEAEAVKTAHRQWVNAAIGGELGQELPLPAHFEQAAKTVRPEDVAESVVCGPDPERHRAKIREYADAGFDHVYVHQVGPDQEGFFRFYADEVLPKLQ